jgi:hypothetical protein
MTTTNRPHVETAGDDDFAHSASLSRPGLLAEMVQYVTSSRKWWVVPVIIALAAAGAMIALGSSVAAPFVYTVF